MIKLSKRLEAISSLVPYNSHVIDIGCDHGYLSIYLCINHISNKIIASDINKNALSNAKENISKYHLEDKITTKLGNGLEVIEDDIDTLIISGMGANTIIDILNKDKLKNIKTIIIQSNTKIPLLREKITKLDYLIADEEIIIDNNKTYIIIKFIKGKKIYNKKELYFGPILLNKKSNIFINYYMEELNKLKKTLGILPMNHQVERTKIIKEINLYQDVI